MRFVPTCDLCDLHKGDTSSDFRVLPPVFQAYGGVAAFAGPVSTVQCFEDNTSVKAAVAAVASAGHDRVLVVDGGGSLRRALVADADGIVVMPAALAPQAGS